MMPGKSGWEVARALKQDPVTQDMKIVMVTAIGEQVNELTSPLYGADAVHRQAVRVREARARDQRVARERPGLPDRREGREGRDPPRSPLRSVEQLLRPGVERVLGLDDAPRIWRGAFFLAPSGSLCQWCSAHRGAGRSRASRAWCARSCCSGWCCPELSEIRTAWNADSYSLAAMYEAGRAGGGDDCCSRSSSA